MGLFTQGEPPESPAGTSCRPVAELRLHESDPIPEVNVYLPGKVDRATIRIEVVQEHPGRMARLVITCLTVLLVTAAVLRIVIVLRVAEAMTG
jgi:hypothetical protein